MSLKSLVQIVLLAALPLSSSGAPGAAATQKSPGAAGYELTRQRYSLPDMTFVDFDGKRVRLRELLEGEKPVVLNFVYASCTTICPILSATFAKAYQLFAAAGEAVRFVSVSIDPEQDTPEQLKKYAAKFKAGENWTFLTGEVQAAEALQRAFGTFRGNKANHPSVILIHTRPGDEWVRLEGVIPAAAVLEQYRQARGSASGTARPGTEAVPASH